jgi:hypothetical protein
MYIPSHYIFLFWEFSSWNVKKPKQYKNGKNALRLQAPVISTIYNVYILSISPPGYQRVTSQKKGILVDVTRDVGDTWRYTQLTLKRTFRVFFFIICVCITCVWLGWAECDFVCLFLFVCFLFLFVFVVVVVYLSICFQLNRNFPLKNIARRYFVVDKKKRLLDKWLTFYNFT